MKFPVSVLDKDEYIDKVCKLLNDSETPVFLDTNILAFLFRLNSKAKEEFYNWIDELVSKNKIKIPTWVINEYTNRFIRRKTSDYLSGASRFSTINKEFLQLTDYLKLHIDDTRLNQSSYKTTEELTLDLDNTIKCLQKIGSVVKSKKDDFIIATHNELKDKFENLNLNSNIFKITEQLGISAQFRYTHRLPPGFEDDKPFNSFGDLIIWSEICAFCGGNNKKAAVIITNDNKKDWMFPPMKIIENGKTKPNSEPEFKIADPRLIFEFKLQTESEDLYIINFENLIKILISGTDGNKYFNLAKSLQILHSLDVPVEESSSIVETTSQEIQSHDDEIIEDIAPNGYSEDALADREFKRIEYPELNNIVELLKTYNWYDQNEAIHKFMTLDIEPYEVTQNLKDFMFVIGRNIYQSACGGAFKAIDVINNLAITLRDIEPASEDVLNGILYEIFFNCDGKLRAKYKNSFYERIFILAANDSYVDSFKFINAELEKNPRAIYLIPLPDTELKTINIISEAIDDNLREVKSIIFTDCELLRDITLDDWATVINFGNKYGLAHHICNKYAFPQERINFKYDSEFPNHINLKAQDKQLKNFRD